MTLAGDTIAVQAYAKVNLTLDVQGRRDDGYHLLSSVMQSISLFDTVILQRQVPGQGILIESDHPLVPTDPTNICWRAAEAFQKYTKVPGELSLSISLLKQIPVGAGLGGGSADAAAILHGLNLLYETELSLDELQAIGVTIGADVPFCLQGGTCLVEGIGEKVTPVAHFPPMTLVLVKPDVHVSTAEIYRQLDPLAHGGDSTHRLLRFLSGDDSLPLGRILENALESVTANLVPEVGEWKKKLGDSGAVATLMSGSGPTVFGLFSSSSLARQFQERFKDEAQVFAVTVMEQGVLVSETNGGDQ